MVARPQTRLVLLGESDPACSRHVTNSLQQAGYDVAHAKGCDDLAFVEAERAPAVVVLDQSVPGSLEAVRRIREDSEVPIILLTGAGAVDDRAGSDGLRGGADGVITKPFAADRLVAQVESLIRRVRRQDESLSRSTYRLHDLYIDLELRTVMLGRDRLHLSAREYALLRALTINAGRVLTHDQLLGLAWGNAYEGDCELLRSFIRALRRKLGDDARNPRYIETEFQVGYWMHRPETVGDRADPSEGDARHDLLRGPRNGAAGRSVRRPAGS